MAGVNRTTGKATDLITFSRASGGTALRKISYGSELVTNGTFDTDTDWTKGTGWTISGGVASVNGAVAVTDLVQSIGVVDGLVYQVTFDITSISANGRLFLLDPEFLTSPITTTGTKTFIVVSSASRPNYISLRALSADANPMTATIDNISVKEVLFDQPDGTLTLFNHPTNIPRIEYAADGTVKGLLIEEARTNLVTYSENPSSWSLVSGATVTADQSTSPNGQLSADLVAEATGTGAHIAADTVSFTSGVTYTQSIFLKKGSGVTAPDILQLTFGSAAFGSSQYANYNILTGEVLTSSGGTALIEAFGNGWYRCVFTATATATTSTTSGLIFTNNNDALGRVPAYNGTTTSDVFIYGFQIEAGSFPTSYIPTSGATATRAADIASISVDNFGYRQDAGTVVVEFDTPSSSAGYIGDQTFATSVAYSSNRDFKTFNGTSTATTGNTFTLGEVAKGVIAYSHSGRAACLNGGAVASTSGEMQYVTTYKFGQSFGGSYLNGHIKSIAYYPRRLSNAQLVQLTA